jgi:hypothetical protein
MICLNSPWMAAELSSELWMRPWSVWTDRSFPVLLADKFLFGNIFTSAAGTQLVGSAAQHRDTIALSNAMKVMKTPRPSKWMTQSSKWVNSRLLRGLAVESGLRYRNRSRNASQDERRHQAIACQSGKREKQWPTAIRTVATTTHKCVAQTEPFRWMPSVKFWTACWDCKVFLKSRGNFDWESGGETVNDSCRSATWNGEKNDAIRKFDLSIFEWMRNSPGETKGEATNDSFFTLSDQIGSNRFSSIFWAASVFCEITLPRKRWDSTNHSSDEIAMPD